MPEFWSRLWRFDPDKNRLFRDTDDRKWHNYYTWMQGEGSSGGIRGGYNDAEKEGVQSDNSVSTEFGRRPYVRGTGGGGTGYVEQMKRTPDKAIFNLNLKRQSEFKKPYKEDDYQEMEYWYPTPSWEFDIPGWGYEDGDGGVVPPDWPDVHDDDWPCPSSLIGQGIIHLCETEYRYRPPSSSTSRFSNVRLTGVAAGDCQIIDWAPHLIKIKCELDTTGTRFPKFYICYDLEGVPRPEGGLCTCKHEVINGCSVCNCLSTTAQSFVDEGTSDTIAPDGVAALTIIDGCPPYSWTTNSNGYTITNPITPDLINSVSCVPAGVCGVDFDPVCTVQVTDACGSSVSQDIRNTAGSWGAAVTGVCLLSGAADSCEGSDSTGYRCTKTSGKYKQFHEVTKSAGSACPDCCVPYDNSPTCGADDGSWCDKFFPTDYATGANQCIMDSVTVCPGTSCFTCWYNLKLEYQEWTC